MTANTTIALKLGGIIGSGASSRVYSATDPASNAVYAVKKSRASMKLKRPLLAYEGRILKLLEGHSGIPELVGYIRVEHFEYLVVEILGRPLNDEDYQVSLRDVACIAHQTISALQHIHGHGIVHRDIKPGNILAYRGRDLSRICVIDFGLARPFISGEPQTSDPVKERTTIVGTAGYASLNAYKGIDLNPRDDLESLAYVLLSLCRGGLPWKKLCRAGPVIGRMLQTRRKMEAWNGVRLAEGYPAVFGELVDYARQLGFHETIDYVRYITSFQELEKSSSATPVHVPPSPTASLEVPVEKGQLVLLQLDIPISVEGYTARCNNSAYQDNPSFSKKEWVTPLRPAVILATKLNHASRNVITAIPLSTNIRCEEGEHLSLAEIGLDDPALQDFDCYSFPRAVEFCCSPEQNLVPTHWKISTEAADNLWSKFNPNTGLNWHETKNANPDIRHDVRIRIQDPIFYINIAPLTPVMLGVSQHQGIPIEWQGKRGWFDECVKAARRWGCEDGYHWTGHSESSDDESEGSYWGPGMSLWASPQQERDIAQSLPDEETIELPRIGEIE